MCQAKAWGGILILTFLSVLAQPSAAQTHPSSAKPDTKAGLKVFKAYCVQCHGDDGTGNTPMGQQLQAADLTSYKVQNLTVAQMTKVVHDGQLNMPSFKTMLTAAQIRDVIAYVRTLK